MIRNVAFFIFLFTLSKGQDCVWNKDSDFPSLPPLLVDLDTWVSLKAVNEGGQRIVRVAGGAKIVVACSGSTISALGVEVAEGVCTGDQFLDIGGTQYTIRDLECSAFVQDGILENQGTCGDGNIGEIGLIGFDVPGYQFYPVARFCFEKGNQITLYSEDVIYGQSVSATDGNPSKPSFRDDDYFYPTIDPNDCYLTANQDQFFSDLLGDSNFIDTDHGIYFSRGHLAPNADFLNDMEADASYYYTNAVPQWQPFNGGNWMYMESDARDLAESHGTDLHVYTGPWENLVLNDVNNNPTTIFLCDSQGQSIIPIPNLVWKVVYEPSSDLGVAIVTSNNPQAATPLTPICPDIGCDQITWLSFDASASDKGYTYCCTVQDLKDAIPHAPDLPSTGLLIS